MTKTVAYHWHLRKIMNEHGMNATTELVPLLADRGVVMTSTQVYRIVTGEPERLNPRRHPQRPDRALRRHQLAARTQDRHHRHQHAVQAQPEPSNSRSHQACWGLTGPDGEHDRPR